MKHVYSTWDRDLKVIEAVVRKFGPLSQVRINELTDIRPTTVSLLVRDLLEEGRILEVGRSNNPVGRKQVLLLPNRECHFVASVAFDEEIVQAAVMDMHPCIRYSAVEKIQLEGSYQLVEQLLACTRRAIEQAGITPESILGIGISDPGLVDTVAGTTVMSSTIPFWKDIPLKAIFEQRLGLPAYLETSTRSKTLAEQMLGRGKMSQNMLYVDYGRGIGAGIIVDGKLIYGNSGAAGEFGHTHILDGGPVCSCGSYGCLEAIAGTRALEDKLHKALADGATTRLFDLIGGDLDNVTGSAVLEGANLGDDTCRSIVAEVARYIGTALSNLVNLFNPSMVILDQRLESGGCEFLDTIVSTMRRQSLSCSNQNLEIQYGAFGNEGSLLGAALAVTERYFEIPMLKPPRFLIEPRLGMATA